VQRGIGDVLLTWENEAFLALNELGPDRFEIVIPSVSILAEASVTVVDKYVDAHGTRQVADEYLKYLYSKEGQNIIAKHFYRPRDKDVLSAHAKKFPKVELQTIEDFGG